MTSNIKTVMLLGMLTGLILLIGGAVGGQFGLIIGLILALVMNLGSYWYSDKIVLRLYKAREVEPHEAPALHSMVEELAEAAGVPKPRICVIPQEAPNAFATGRDPAHGVVAVTEGIMRLLSPDELKGVLAHEMGHIKNRDILIQSVAGVMASVIMFAANMVQWAAIFGIGSSSDDDEGSTSGIGALLLAFIAPVAAMLIQMAISRSREYLADETGARISGNPLSLAGALEKLDGYSKQIPMRAGSEGTAHMFIVNPFTTSRVGKWFSTHPPMADRVQRLRAMVGGGRGRGR